MVPRSNRRTTVTGNGTTHYAVAVGEFRRNGNGSDTAA
ncbi:hypothetical protein SLI_6062 [Streptomyces lividans 1326]|uniref:Uncharacterized protein n=1 Tax=Streptomyces lividans 1326 TaxID=1200984 RepID=A0A7U9HE07_STRLI|nr:hypothetical protein SLI_6062 [Streptomyces lividans 1326]